MESKQDWPLTFDVVAGEIARRGLSLEAWAKASGIHRSTLYRMRDGERLSDAKLQQIEGALGLPRDLLLYVAEGDIETIRALDVDPDLQRWLLKKLAG